MDAGEKITGDSPIIIDWLEFRKSGKVKKIQRKSLCTRITRAMRKSGVRLEENSATDQLGRCAHTA